MVDVTHAEKVLTAIEAVIEGRASLDQQSYTLAGVSLTRMPITDLLIFRDKYRAEVNRQKNATRFKDVPGGGRIIYTRFR